MFDVLEKATIEKENQSNYSRGIGKQPAGGRCDFEGCDGTGNTIKGEHHFSIKTCPNATHEKMVNKCVFNFKISIIPSNLFLKALRLYDLLYS